MTANGLIAWRKRLDLNRIEASLSLGICRNSLTAYESGRRPIPLTVALAAAALSYGLPPIDE